MAFDSYSVGQTESTNKPTVDFDALNKYVVETSGLQQRETLTGYIAGIVDLGTQELEDAEQVFLGDAAAEAKLIEEKPDTYFKDGFDDKGKPARLKCWPQKPQQCVTLAIDFPEIMLNKGQFFGDDKGEEKPLRLWLGGQFYLKDAGMVVGRPIPLRVSNIAEKGAAKAVWSLAPNHTLYKMALGAKLIKPGEVFLPKNIDGLLGVSLQFEAQVFFKESKGKQYFTEYVKYVSGLGRGQSAKELATTPFMIQVNQKNSPEALKELRNHVVNTIKRAENYAGSLIEKELGEARPARQEESEKADDTPAANPVPKSPSKPVKAAPKAPVDDDFSSDCPF